MEQTIQRMMELAGKQYNCSQIIVKLGLERQGNENPDLIRSMESLAHGCAFFKATCGALTGAACLLGLYAGRGLDEEPPSEPLNMMLEELGGWFQETYGQPSHGMNCENIVGDLVGTDKGRELCGPIVLQSYLKAIEILHNHGYAPPLG